MGSRPESAQLVSDMGLPLWHPPKRAVPSESYLGERDKDILHTAVGRALNEWELVESSLSLIFGHFVESKSPAARRSYGTIISAVARNAALEAAAIEFFREKEDESRADLFALIKAHLKAAQYRNNIAHGICYGWLYIGGRQSSPGWFLCPPNYNTRKNDVPAAGAAYIYKAADIDHCKKRFEQLATEATDLDGYLRKKYPL
jgi:hypothetical protein